MLLKDSRSGTPPDTHTHTFLFLFVRLRIIYRWVSLVGNKSLLFAWHCYIAPLHNFPFYNATWIRNVEFAFGTDLIVFVFKVDVLFVVFWNFCICELYYEIFWWSKSYLIVFCNGLLDVSLICAWEDK